MKKSSLLAVDFFSGAGGVTYGFRKAGIKVLAGIDIDTNCKETYEKNNKGSKFIASDISKLKPEELEFFIDIKPNMDNMVFIGCSPCQYYTILNTEKEKSAKGKLLLEEFRRFVEYFKPGYIFIENVPGIERKKESPLSKFKDYIQSIGYSFDEAVINATGYNVPQSRKRYVLMATRIKKNISIPPARKNKKLTVRNTIGKFKPIPAGHKDKTSLKHVTAGLIDVNKLRLKKTSHNGGTRMEWKDNKDLQLTCYKGRDEIFRDVYGRLYWDAPSPTITTKYYSISNGRFAHPEQDRAISLREGASLQSFPKSYKFYSDNIVTVARMVGNAVPPKMAKKIGEAFIKNYLNA